MAGPGAFDVLILGGGTAGCVLASRLSEQPERSVCLVEAGPDYGPHGSPDWPPEMLDARLPPTSHDWSDGERSLSAARIVGGCSAHNGCTLVRAAPADYAAWGEDAWTYEALLPYLDRAERRLDPIRFEREDYGSWFGTVVAGCAEAGIPVHDDSNAPGVIEGVGPVPVNVRGTTRWNAAFAYLDPARARPNLTVMGDTLVDRVELEDGRAAGAVVVTGGERRELRADLVVLCAGAYGSPAILLRSGIGAADELARHEVPLVAELPVGERLRDHFGIPVRWGATEAMEQLLLGEDPLLLAQGLVKARSSDCPEGLWDMHLLIGVFPANGQPADPDGFVLSASAMLVQPEWRGTVRLRSRDPAVLPEVTEYHLGSDRDLSHALEGVELSRRIARAGAARGLVGEELAPGPGADGDSIRASGRAGLTAFFHPVGTCPMGSVADAGGRVLGIEGLVLADASLIPEIPRSGPFLTVLAMAEKIAETLGD